jgi:hypothetical protein
MSLDIYFTTNRCECCGRSDEVFHANITHNVNTIASEAGIYNHLWHPERKGVEVASDLIRPLEAGIRKMRDNPARFERLNSPNGWGTYKRFLPWLEKLLSACYRFKDADVSVSI